MYANGDWDEASEAIDPDPSETEIDPNESFKYVQVHQN
jgi:hypothetical protein